MVGHSAQERLEVEARSDSPPLQALSQRLLEILRAHRLLRADRLLLLTRPAHIIEMSFSLPAGEAGREQRSAVTAPEESFQRSFDGTMATGFRAAELVFVIHFLPQLARDYRFLLAGIGDALVRNVPAIQNIRLQQPQRG